jgi:hypothetical protein
MMSANQLSSFLEFLSHSLQNKQFIRIILSKKRNKDSELKSVTARVIMLKNELMLSFV